MDNCVFCQIIAGKIPAQILFEDAQVIVIPDAHPAAPTHLLVIPRKHIPSLNELEADDTDLVGHMVIIGREMARKAGIAESGFRLVINTGPQAGQSVYHLHLHVLGGMQMPVGLQVKGLH
ncbi:MAG TPA: histidine triad nucleotide-binding protein [Anaerolineaceae bacterium]|jgi:histidine triad (HIT) family protein|nr:histidine triad nucleotide-binding protein [Anaerolineaceae bacterium]